MKNKFIVFFCAVAVLFFGLLANAYSHDYHHYESVTVTNAANNNGVALAIAASQHQFDFGTHRWQGSIAAGSFGGESALSFGVAKRLDRVLLNGSFGMQGSSVGIGIGANWRF